MPAYIHSDRGPSFMSRELREFLTTKGISSSQTTSYNPQGNGQAERYNGTIWKAITMALMSRGLSTECWQYVLPDALHSVRSLLCTTTNATPHERLLNFSRRSTTGSSVPTWLCNPGPVLLKKHVRLKKTDPFVEEVELIQANPNYAHVRYPDGRETTVSIRHLAPRESRTQPHTDINDSNATENTYTTDAKENSTPTKNPDSTITPSLDSKSEVTTEVPPLRRSTRVSHPPDRLNL